MVPGQQLIGQRVVRDAEDKDEEEEEAHGPGRGGPGGGGWESARGVGILPLVSPFRHIPISVDIDFAFIQVPPVLRLGSKGASMKPRGSPGGVDGAVAPLPALEPERRPTAPPPGVGAPLLSSEDRFRQFMTHFFSHSGNEKFVCPCCACSSADFLSPTNTPCRKNMQVRIS